MTFAIIQKKISVFTTLFALLAVTGLSGCTTVGVAAGAGATVGIAAAQEGGISGAATDAAIRIQIMDAWFRHDVELYRRLGITVREGRVLVTGTVPTPDDRVEAIRLVWQVKEVKQVINEVRVDDEGATVGSYVQDTWITGNVKTLLMFDKQIQSINYTVETVGGTVYLMGIAQTQHELDRAINHARNTKFVKNVVSYVRVRGEPAAEMSGVGTDVPVPGPAPVMAPSAADDMTSSQYEPTNIAPADNSVESAPLDDMTGNY